MDEMEDFLKREQMALGADAALFQTSDPVPLSNNAGAGIGAVNGKSQI